MCFMTFINLSSWENHNAEDKVTSAPAWCMAAIGVGTYVRSVVMPSPTCIQAMTAMAVAALAARGGNGAFNDFRKTYVTNASVVVPRILLQ